MRTITKLLALSAIGLLAFVSASKLQAQAVGQWDFNSSNLTATVGATLGDMTYNDGTTAAVTQFGTTTGLGISNILGTNAIVMGFPAATNGMGYQVPTPPANGGGSTTVNQYTYILDVYYPTASSGKIRPLIRTYASGGTEEYIVIDATGAIGPAVVGSGGVTSPGVGNLLPNTWYRIAISVTAGGTIRVYTNGVAVGSFGGDLVDRYFALTANSTALVLGTTSTNAALGYVNSIQLRDSVLSAGQIAALGAASAPGIPLVIPPVPSFIASRSPDVAQTGVSQAPAINIVLDQGDTTVSSGTIQLRLDGVIVPATVTPTPPTYTIAYTVTNRLDPLSVHTLVLTYSDSVAGSKTNTWTFTVKDYQVVTLPTPFYFENFESLTENPTNGIALPAGWTVQNQTGADQPGLDLANLRSDTYKDWALVSATRIGGFDANKTNTPTIILNGVELSGLASGNLMYAESDSRGGNPGEYQELYTANINCTGRSNVFVAWNSLYMQNQDNMDLCEYSVDNGANWLPVIYYLQFPGDAQSAEPDIRYTNGMIDCCSPRQYVNVTNYVANSGGTFNRIDDNRNWSPDIPTHATNYGIYVKAPINSSINSYVKARINDDTLDGKRIEVVRLPAADNAATVKFRFLNTGTASWFWGIDNLGLYEINTPVISTHPASLTIAAGTGTNLSVVASSPSPLSYQWQHAGTNISNGGHYSGVTNATLTLSNVDTNDAGAYRVKVSNSSGFVFSNPGILTVVTIPTVITQPISAVVSAGYPASFSALGFGGLPLSYQWLRNGSPVGGATGTNLSFASTDATNTGNYTVVITNSYGSVTSRVARLTVVTVPVTNNLVVYLKFDGNYNDSSGRGNNATPVGSPTFVAGKIGNAMQYTDGDSGSSINYVTLDNPVGTHPTDLRMVADVSFSISFWYKVPVGNRHGDPAIVANKDWDSGSNDGFSIFNSGSGLQWNYTEVNDGINLNTRKDSGGTSPGIEDGNWHHCLVVFDRGANGDTYVDGNLVKTLPLATPSPGGFYAPTTIDNDPPVVRTRTATGAWNIGTDGSGLYSTVGGGHDGPGISVTNAMIDDVGVWRRAISPQEALAIYNGGNAGQTLAQAVVPLSKLTISLSGGNVNFSWAGGTGIRLQKKTGSIVGGTWTDIISTLGNSTHSEAITATPTFYRLFKP